MLHLLLAEFYERDIRRMIEEVNLFQDEGNLWRTGGSIKNSGGNLVLHITGGTNYLIGALIGKTGYVRDREQEFARKGVDRKELLEGLAALIPMVGNTLRALSAEEMEAEYPMVFDGAKRTHSYLLVALLAHLNYHLGQVNYLRRMLE